MSKEIQTIGVLTSGGDAPGMKELREVMQVFCRKRLLIWKQKM